ncbi:MAG: hypothetical protein BWY51_00179 [Parcubacteria group bacterium ADurb.Bin316]|nr:MAG: hypothetical protein BWY51_00179 [Parcubacteria group bacterium ADurb.Bin316]HOZ56182.1 hypothetical protein [bacterium]
MPTKKTNAKNARTPNKNKKPTDQIAIEIKRVTDELVNLAKEAKKKYDKVDDKTKKQVVAGVAGAAALIAAAIGISKMRKK